MPGSSITSDRLYGTWRLVRATAVDANGIAISPPYGPVPMGRLVLSPQGRMMAVICDGRNVLPEGETRAYASYCGNFRVADNQLITAVDAAALDDRIGTEQIRRLEMRGDHLVLIPPRRADGVQRELMWRRDGPA
jgi:hypothetical protein